MTRVWMPFAVRWPTCGGMFRASVQRRGLMAIFLRHSREKSGYRISAEPRSGQRGCGPKQKEQHGTRQWWQWGGHVAKYPKAESTRRVNEAKDWMDALWRQEVKTAHEAASGERGRQRLGIGHKYLRQKTGGTGPSKRRLAGRRDLGQIRGHSQSVD